MTMVKTLVALATERMLLKTSGPTFLRGIEFMYAAGLAPDRLSVMMTSSHKYVLQFHSKCDIRPFAANYPNFGRVLRGIVHVREWRIKSIEFVNVAFYMRDVENLERAIEKLGVELVLLRNCTYPGVQRGDEAVKFLSALNRKKQAVVCEYGDDRLKHRIGRRTSGHRTRRASRNGQEVVAPPGGDPAEVVAVAPAGVANAAQAAADANAPQPPAAANNDAPAVRVVAPNGVPGVRRPIPLNPEQARQLIPQNLQPQAAPAQEAQGAPIARIVPVPHVEIERRSEGRVVVGAHVYEFRAIDVPNGDIPQVHNLNHLLNVLNENAGNDVRVIVLPSRGGVPGGPIHLNNNDQIYRHISQQQPAGAAGVAAQPARPVAPEPPAEFVPIRDRAIRLAQLRNLQQEQLAEQQYDMQPAQLMVAPGMIAMQNRQRQAQQPTWNAYPVVNAPPAIQPRGLVVPVQVPMFGVAVNEPQVQRNGDDSNDSTDREEMYDPEQQRNEALRDLVADPEAQPNFAPVEAQAVDLDMLEEEGEGERDDDEVMEGVVVDGQFMMDDQAVMQ